MGDRDRDVDGYIDLDGTRRGWSWDKSIQYRGEMETETCTETSRWTDR